MPFSSRKGCLYGKMKIPFYRENIWVGTMGLNKKQKAAAAVTLLKLQQYVDNDLQTTALLRLWSDGKLHMQKTLQYDPSSPVIYVSTFKNGQVIHQLDPRSKSLEN